MQSLRQDSDGCDALRGAFRRKQDGAGEVAQRRYGVGESLERSPGLSGAQGTPKARGWPFVPLFRQSLAGASPPLARAVGTLSAEVLHLRAVIAI